MTTSAEAPVSAPRSARARVRAELTREITDTARRHLAEHGAAGLSLRAVARELGMASSAVYRYVASRDELLTTLIIDAFDAVGGVAEQADASVPAGDVAGRWLAVCRAVRAWARANPHEYFLIYGTPVPGYVAPQDTVGPATRITNVLLGIAATGAALGVSAGVSPLPPAVHADLAAARARHDIPVPEHVFAAGLMAWMELFGAISMELNGHLHTVVEDNDAFFDAAMATVAERLGIAPAGSVADPAEVAPGGGAGRA